jgi:hypothetical protein
VGGIAGGASSVARHSMPRSRLVVADWLESMMVVVTPLGTLLTALLFPTLDAHVIDLLRSLAPDDWDRQTIEGHD